MPKKIFKAKLRKKTATSPGSQPARQGKNPRRHGNSKGLEAQPASASCIGLDAEAKALLARIRSASFDEAFVRDRLDPAMQRMAGSARSATYAYLEMIYALGCAALYGAGDKKSRRMKALGLRPTKSPFIQLLNRYSDLPKDETRKKVQSMFSRHSRALDGAKAEGVMPGELAQRLAQEGGVEAFMKLAAKRSRKDEDDKDRELAIQAKVPGQRGGRAIAMSRGASLATVRAGPKPAINRQAYPAVDDEDDDESISIEVTGRSRKTLTREIGIILLAVKGGGGRRPPQVISAQRVPGLNEDDADDYLSKVIRELDL